MTRIAHPVTLNRYICLQCITVMCLFQPAVLSAQTEISSESGYTGCYNALDGEFSASNLRFRVESRSGKVESDDDYYYHVIVDASNKAVQIKSMLIFHALRDENTVIWEATRLKEGTAICKCRVPVKKGKYLSVGHSFNCSFDGDVAASNSISIGGVDILCESGIYIIDQSSDPFIRQLSKIELATLTNAKAFSRKALGTQCASLASEIVQRLKKGHCKFAERSIFMREVEEQLVSELDCPNDE